MSKLEQAARQALEALESKLGETHPFAHDLEKAAAIRTLRDALAVSEQRMEEQAEQKPVGMVMGGELVGLVDEYKTGAWPIYAAPQPVITPDVCGEVCVRAKLCYGCGKALDEANAKFTEQTEQEPVLYSVRRGSRITCIESGEKCVVWATSHTDCWVQFPDGHAGQYTYEQIGKYFSIEENQAADEAYERGSKEGIKAGKKIAEQAEQEPVAVVEITYGREPECYVTGNGS